MSNPEHNIQPKGVVEKIILFCLERKLVVFLLIFFLVGWGAINAPFDWNLPFLVRNPVPTDAIPDIGENQQIVFTKWPGRSPQDIEDQVTYPLTVALLGISGIKSIRSYSMFGISSIYIIFKEEVEFYWSRSRILEKLASLGANSLPPGVSPTLGPDATGLGQVFLYTLEGRDEKGKPTGGWDLDELRSVQDWYVRYALSAVEGVSEVSSIGGFVKEYQIDVDPDAMRAFQIPLNHIFMAVKNSNIDVGARNIEINGAEYVIRGLGYIKNLEDIENTVITERDNQPVFIKDVAKVSLGPALRRGALDKGGAEAVGGVVVTRYGENPLKTISNVKEKIKEITKGLPEKILSDGRKSKITIVPYYDRTELILETLGTLNHALTEEVIITIIVVLISLLHLTSSLVISCLIPLAVLFTFIAMKQFGVDANIVSLSGIAIAIGTMVDMGIVMCENIIRHLNAPENSEKSSLEIIFVASSEVGSAIITAVSTTIVSFLPIFSMIGAEGKLFKPLAFTKSFALLGSILVSLVIIPPLAHLLFKKGKKLLNTENLQTPFWKDSAKWTSFPLIIIMFYILGIYWEPLGPSRGLLQNLIFVGMIVGGVLGFFYLLRIFYLPILGWCLTHKKSFFSVPLLVIFGGLLAWLGSARVLGFLPQSLHHRFPLHQLGTLFPGLGKEFMPPLNEGSFLFMPTTMAHASIGESMDILQMQDIAIKNIPEVSESVGKIGRVESPLDPAPIYMVETIINYIGEFHRDVNNKILLFKFDPDKADFFRNIKGEEVPAPDGKPYKVPGTFPRNGRGELIPSPSGVPFRLWRTPLDPELNPGRKVWDGINTNRDIWDEVVRVTQIPGVTLAPFLQPIATRIIMLQSGMRAPMGIKVKGPSLEVIEKFGLKLEKLLKNVEGVEAQAVFADRIVGKPYLELKIDRLAAARHGVSIGQLQEVIEIAVGGKKIMETVEGRERYPVRVRYLRELRDSPAAIENILVPARNGSQVPLKQLVSLNYRPGPQLIKSEDTFLVGYVLFDKKTGFGEVDVVVSAQNYLNEKISSGELEVPPGVSFRFSGNFENQVRSEKKLMLVIPVALFIIFIILYLEFKSVLITLMIFSTIFVAWSGGFLTLWAYNQPWFLNFSFFGVDLRSFFNIGPINLSVAVWVGFLALFGIASDDGVIMGSYLVQKFENHPLQSVSIIQETVMDAASKRIRPCLMTVSTTVLALIPVLSSTGRGSDIMGPMAIPTFGGMLVVLLTVFLVPTLFCTMKEFELKFSSKGEAGSV